MTSPTNARPLRADETPDSDRIAVDDATSVADWARRLAVTEQQIRDAVAAVGPLGADVEMHLKGTRAASNADEEQRAD